MSERDDDERAPDDSGNDQHDAEVDVGGGTRDDTLPETPAGELERDAAEPMALESAGIGDADATLVDGPALQESPERAGRRVAPSGLRVGTRLVLGLVLASVLPTAMAASSVLFLKPPPSPTVPAPPTEPLTMEELRTALAELKALDAAWADATRSEAEAAAPKTTTPPAIDNASSEAAPVNEGDTPEAAASVMPPAPPPPAPVKPRVAPPPPLEVTRAVLVKASALAPLREAGPQTPAADLDAVRARVVVGALVLALLASLILGLRLRKDLTLALSALDARLRLLASGQPSERANAKRPAEIAELDDAVDALCRTLGSLRARDEADRQRAERVFSLAEGVDAAARGQLTARLPTSDDVAEATLAAAVNRMIDAFERQVVRLKSHAQLLSSDTGEAPAQASSDDDNDADGDADPATLVAKRVSGLRPIPPLLTDIAGRLATLSRMPAGEARVPDDLAKLSEAIAQRARAAQAIFDSLEAQLALLPRASGAASAALTTDQQRALQKLVDDLESLAVDSSLPRLVESLPELPASDVASRLARTVTSA